jgi:hypothetical protein
MEVKTYCNFRMKFIILGVIQNFIRISRFKLALARLKLTDIPDTRYIYFIFLEPRTYFVLHVDVVHSLNLDLNQKNLILYKGEFKDNPTNPANPTRVKG